MCEFKKTLSLIVTLGRGPQSLKWGGYLTCQTGSRWGRKVRSGARGEWGNWAKFGCVGLDQRGQGGKVENSRIPMGSASGFVIVCGGRGEELGRKLPLVEKRRRLL